MIKSKTAVFTLVFFITITSSSRDFIFADDADGIIPISDGIIPISTAFHNIGWNVLRSFTYNYGLNFAAAGLGTWAFIGTGLDREWRNIAYKNENIAAAGLPSLYIGYVVPGIAPLITYITGRKLKNTTLQITGLALAQTLVLTISIQSVLKMSTGRALPGIGNYVEHTKNPRTDDFSGEFNWFNMNFIGGWPSAHTANAFSAAAVIAEIYHDNIWLKIAAYTYAALIGLGVSVTVHWASDVFAGALTGYAIGKVTGKSFRNLLENDGKTAKASLYISYNTIGVIINTK